MTALRYLCALEALVMLIACGLGDRNLPACKAPNQRAWCRGIVKQSTEARAAQGLPAACEVPFAATACVDRNYMGGLMEALSRFSVYSRSFYSGPGGWPPYIMVGDNAFWVQQAKNDAGQVDCLNNGQQANPWPTLPIVDLDAAVPFRPGLRAPPLRPQGAGGAGSAEGDCALCLAAAQCMGLTPAECIQQHCAALCPTDTTTSPACELGAGGGAALVCTPAGADCSTMGCCPPMACFASDSGARTCQ